MRLRILESIEEKTMYTLYNETFEVLNNLV